MGLFLRKSFKLAPGVRFNISTCGMSLSSGFRGARISTGTRGVNIYGGVGPVRYAKKLGGSRGRSSSPSGGLGCLVLVGAVLVVLGVSNAVWWYQALPRTTQITLVAGVVILALGGIFGAVARSNRREAERVAAERTARWSTYVERIEAMLNAVEALQRPATRLSRADEAVRIVRGLEAEFPDEAPELMAQIERWVQTVVFDVLIEDGEDLAAAGDGKRAKAKFEKALELLRGDQIEDEKQGEIIQKLECRLSGLSPGSLPGTN